MSEKPVCKTHNVFYTKTEINMVPVWVCPECAKQTGQLHTLPASAVTVVDNSAHVRELERQVKEMEADARRLDFLERLFEKRWNAVIDSGSRTYWSVWVGHRNVTSKMEGKTFRDAIDTASATLNKEQPNEA